MGTTHPQYAVTKVELYGANNDGNPRRYAIADGIAVSKNTIVYLTDPRTASGAALGSVAVAGIAAEEVTSTDNPGSISVWTDGIFEMTARQAVGVGHPVCADSHTQNTFKEPASAQLASGAVTFGYCMETATADERVNVRVRL